MSAHLLIPAWDSQRPATLSNAILTGQLQDRLGFEGLIVTDALIMGGVTKYASPEEIAVMAVEAGADILLMPQDPEVAIASVYQAVESGRLTKERIYASVAKIWQAKQKIFSLSDERDARTRSSSLGANLASLEVLANPNAIATVDAILRDSMQTGGSLSIKPLNEEKGRNLIVVDDLLNCDFLDRHTPAVTIPKQLGYEIQLLDQNSLEVVAGDTRKTLLQVFIRANPFRGVAGLTPKTRQFYQELLASGLVGGLIIYGSPYVLEWFCSQLPSELPWVFSYGQIDRAQAIALEFLFDLSKVSGMKKDTF